MIAQLVILIAMLIGAVAILGAALVGLARDLKGNPPHRTGKE